MWWFLLIFMSPAMVGPFQDFEQCEAIRLQVEQARGIYGAMVTECWEGPAARRQGNPRPPSNPEKPA